MVGLDLIFLQISGTINIAVLILLHFTQARLEELACIFSPIPKKQP
jgi:hypothetical protein